MITADNIRHALGQNPIIIGSWGLRGLKQTADNKLEFDVNGFIYQGHVILEGCEGDTVHIILKDQEYDTPLPLMMPFLDERIETGGDFESYTNQVLNTYKIKIKR